MAFDREAKFVQPENLRADQIFDFGEPPAATDSLADEQMQGYEYLGTPEVIDIPVESKQSLEEQKILQEASNPKNQVPLKDEKKPDATPTKTEPLKPEEKKKNSFLKRVFGGNQ